MDHTTPRSKQPPHGAAPHPPVISAASMRPSISPLWSTVAAASAAARAFSAARALAASPFFFLAASVAALSWACLASCRSRHRRDSDSSAPRRGQPPEPRHRPPSAQPLPRPPLALPPPPGTAIRCAATAVCETSCSPAACLGGGTNLAIQDHSEDGEVHIDEALRQAAPCRDTEQGEDGPDDKAEREGAREGGCSTRDSGHTAEPETMASPKARAGGQAHLAPGPAAAAAAAAAAACGTAPSG